MAHKNSIEKGLRIVHKLYGDKGICRYKTSNGKVISCSIGFLKNDTYFITGESDTGDWAACADGAVRLIGYLRSVPV